LTYRPVWRLPRRAHIWDQPRQGKTSRPCPQSFRAIAPVQSFDRSVTRSRPRHRGRVFEEGAERRRYGPRRQAQTKLHDLAAEFEGRVEIEILDICEPEQIAALRDRLAGRVFDIPVRQRRSDKQNETIADVSTEEFVRVMVTNLLSPMRVIESLQDLVAGTVTIGVMSSGQGSVRQQSGWPAGSVSRQQGGSEHVHAQLRGSQRRNIARHGAAGARLGPH
jgi:hypothetical protein